jgi:SAM-dependent methyltransferase
MHEKIGNRDGDGTIADRIGVLMQHLNINAAHLGASAPMELAPFMSANSNALSSLTLLNASRFPLDVLPSFTDRLLIFSGDAGLGGEAMQRARSLVAGAQIVEFADYPAAVWTDMANDHADRIAGSMLEFLARKDQSRPATRLSGEEREGVVAGITFDISGEGPAILLFPAVLAPSQWSPVLDHLTEKFTVVRLGGPHLGMVFVLEDRGGDRSSIRALRGMVHDAQVRSTDRLLEVGCGSGIISRWFAREQICATPISAIDLNPFLLREAQALAESEGLGDAIEFEPGNAEALPYPDNTFDVVLSVTLIEECHADKALSEMVRVLKPGGRAMIKVRACDMNVLWNLPVDADIKAKAEEPIRQVAPAGCADASLMQRMHGAGLEAVIAYPTFFGGEAHQDYFEPIALSRLNDAEQAAWRVAKATALAKGTFYMMHPAHCAVGTKPR